LLVQNLGRLEESNAEDADGVYGTLNVFENLVEFRPSLSITLCTKTGIIKFLLKRLKSKKFDSNKLYASELLSILLQDNAALLGDVGGMDGVDELLQAAAHYRKRDPASEV
jgi:beta-catenin-like protein 1